LIVLTGPTASGKTTLSFRLAKKFGGEIVSADSRQVYQGLDIGTAKPPISPLRRSRKAVKSSVPSNDGTHYVLVDRIPHYLIDIKNPNQRFTLAQYKRAAEQAIRKISKKGKVPFLVGGTGLYLEAIVRNLEIPAVKPNKKLRTRLEKQMLRHGLPYLFGKLTVLDPEAAYIVDPHNPRRVIRALEVTLTTKQPFTKQRRAGTKKFSTLMLGLAVNPKLLQKKIAKRTRAMFDRGLINEVKRLVRSFGARKEAFDAIGYREVIDYLAGKITRDEAEKQINRNTWRFARRQYTYLKRLPIIWVTSQGQAEKQIRKFLEDK
ncbi:MAG: tRNA (adenosine(37)-N6)-dimethylallyltransferase MiaA, partial [Candidatus Doudnabacteria bacterium]|nr:tRNA (adenosine(37)-N6)-dimethylallyltransferase MiaA [Candidatus Doudnabacteria bacterium]